MTQKTLKHAFLLLKIKRGFIDINRGKTATTTRTLDQYYQQKMFCLIGVIFKESSVFLNAF